MINLQRAGYTQDQIAEQLKVTNYTVIKAFNEHFVARRKRADYPRGGQWSRIDPETGRSALSEKLEPHRAEIRRRLLAGEAVTNLSAERGDAYDVPYPALLKWIKTSGVLDRHPLSLFVLRLHVLPLDRMIRSAFVEVGRDIGQIAEDLALEPWEVRWRLLAQGVDVSGEPADPDYDARIGAMLDANADDIKNQMLSQTGGVRAVIRDYGVTGEQVAEWTASRLLSGALQS